MQELARFFFRSQTAQAGIEEPQLIGIIAQYFRDTGGVEPPADRERAAQFLDFCADRAWLLSRKGDNDRGVRLFAFTHRTFMEYLAAEAIVRRADDIAAIAHQIINIFEKDPSSVLPDVMVQVADDKFDRGAELVLTRLLEVGRAKAHIYGDKFLYLCLRIVNSAPMSSTVTEFLPERILYYWKRIGSLHNSLESTTSLFELYRDPRRKLLKALSVEPSLTTSYDVDQLRYEICRRWARFARSPRIQSLEDTWTEDLTPHFQLIAAEPDRHVKEVRTFRGTYIPTVDETLIDFMLDHGWLQPGDEVQGKLVYPRFCVDGLKNDEQLPGSGMEAIKAILFGKSDPLAESRIYILKSLFEYVASYPRVGVREAETLDDVLWAQLVTLSREPTRPELQRYLLSNPQHGSIIVWLAFVMWEQRGGSHFIHDFLQDVWPDLKIEQLGKLRSKRLRRTIVEAKRDLAFLSQPILDSYGSIIEPWIRGKRLVDRWDEYDDDVSQASR
jgi:hypothetical protein